MKVIIAGGRNITDYKFVSDAMSHDGAQYIVSKLTEVVSGGAKGVDYLGESWAEISNKPYKIFKANWKKHGRAAGPIRNEEMGDYADALIAVWDGKSSGTKHMINYMRKLNKPVFVYILSDEEMESMLPYEG